jgi:hypothetical protein
MLSLPAVKFFVVILKGAVFFPFTTLSQHRIVSAHYRKVPLVETLGPFLVVE